MFLLKKARFPSVSGSAEIEDAWVERLSSEGRAFRVPAGFELIHEFELVARRFALFLLHLVKLEFVDGGQRFVVQFFQRPRTID